MTEKKKKKEYYFVLNTENRLEKVFYGTTKQVCKFLNGQVGERGVGYAARTQRVFEVDGEKCIIIEDFDRNEDEEEEEIWSLFDEGKKCRYYVSNKGKIKRKSKSTEQEFIVTPFINNRNEAVVGVNGKTKPVKNLVAKHFVPEYAKLLKVTSKPLVRVKGEDPFNCSADNLEVYQAPKIKRKPKAWRQCALYENGKKVKVYRNAKEAANDLLYDHSDIIKYFNKVPHVKTLPFDLRLV